jgi:hypothetical protein
MPWAWIIKIQEKLEFFKTKVALRKDKEKFSNVSPAARATTKYQASRFVSVGTGMRHVNNRVGAVMKGRGGSAL